MPRVPPSLRASLGATPCVTACISHHAHCLATCTLRHGSRADNLEQSLLVGGNADTVVGDASHCLSYCVFCVLSCILCIISLCMSVVYHVVVPRLPSTSLERGASLADLGDFDHGNIVADHVQRLEDLAKVRGIV